MEKGWRQIRHWLPAAAGCVLVYLGVLILNRQYPDYGDNTGRSMVIWLGLHFANALVQLMVPLLFALAGYLTHRQRVSLAVPVQTWLYTVGALTIGTVVLFVGWKQFTLGGMLNSFLPLSYGVSAVLSGFILCLVIQPILFWLMERFGAWLGWVASGITVVIGSLISAAQQNAGDFKTVPLMVGLFVFGMVLQRLRLRQLRGWLYGIFVCLTTILIWGSQAVLADVSMYFNGDYRWMDQLAGPFSLPVVLLAAMIVVGLGRWGNAYTQRLLVTAMVVAFAVSQSPVGAAAATLTRAAGRQRGFRFALVSLVVAGIAGLGTVLWLALGRWWLRRPGQWLTTNLSFTANGAYRQGLQQLYRAVKRLFQQNWPPILLLITFYGTVFGSFLAMSPTGKIAIGMQDDYQPIMNYLFTDGQKMIVYTVLFLLAAFFILYVLTTRFWLSFILTEAIYIVWTIANVLKVTYRSAPITPADLHELASLPELLAMVGQYTIWWVLVGVVSILTVIIFLEWRLPRRISLPWTTRIGGLLLGFALLYSPATANSPTSYSHVFNTAWGNTQNLVTPLRGVQRSGPLLQFVSAVDVQVMDRPQGYSENRVKTILQHYRQRAKIINRSRTTAIGDQTVIFNLSESFTDPRQFPDVTLTGTDPMPYIRQLTTETTGGHMLSAGYGGGTANMEYEALTGLVMGNFAANVVPFSQVVPRDTQVPAFNQNFPYAVAIHPYNGTFYNRPQVYAKMGFAKYAYLGSRYPITDQSKIQDSPYLSDKTAYANALKQINSKAASQFIELVTMQNHMPYETSYYPNNPFKGKAKGVPVQDKYVADAFTTFTYGVNQTDNAVAQFLAALDQIKKPVTVVFYGDHLPGIISNRYLSLRPVRMHATTFFIYSNKASKAHNTKLKNTNYVGTNDFIPLVLEHLNAQVSPYEALLTDVDHDLPIMSMPPNQKKNKAGKVKTSPAWVGDDGDWYNVKKMTTKQKQLYADYRMIQYDITAGRQYALQDKAFMTNPGRK